jgi:hypothetical protein
VQGFFLLLLLFFAFYQFSLPLKTYARMLFLLFQQALLRKALSYGGNIKVRVSNPVTWLMENQE